MGMTQRGWGHDESASGRGGDGKKIRRTVAKEEQKGTR
jgi:hypothetical protein